ncbi:MAG: DEAD/DEAH box helicase [Alistipes sp.]|nr:DEAD/DEAH box helicase [Alistipes sp.]
MGTFHLAELMNHPHDHKVDFARLDFAQDTTLRDYQIDNKRKIYLAWQKHRSIMLQMPTGTGKTRLFVSIVRDLHHWGARNKHAVKVLILAHRKELIEQIDETLGLKYHQVHGIIMSQNMEQRKYPVQIGSVPTLTRRLERWISKEFDVIIIDEAHHVKARSYKEIIKQFPNAKILGVTATPYRLNGAGFRPEFDELIVSDPVSTFIKKGYLSDYHYYSISSSSGLQAEIDTMKIDKLDGDYLDSEMMNVMDRQEIRAKIVNTYLKYAKGKKGIVYTVNKEHNQHIKDQFTSVGVKAEVVTSDTPKEERDAIVNKFRNGDIDVLCNVNIFSEGFDCPDIEFVQLARPTCSLAMYLQQVGRGLRPAEGKNHTIILDNVGLYNKFGFPSAKRKWRHHFEGKEVKEIEPSELELEQEEGFRVVTPIEEGDEQVQLLHDSKTEAALQNDEQDMHQHKKQIQEKLAILSTNIEGLKAMGIPIPQDWLDQVEAYKNQLNPTRKIEQALRSLIKRHTDYVADFEYHSPHKINLSAEKHQLDEISNEAQHWINHIKTIIENTAQIGGLSIPDALKVKRIQCDAIIELCLGRKLFLDDVEALLEPYVDSNNLHIVYQKGKLHINDCSESTHQSTEGVLVGDECTSNSKNTKLTRLRIILPNGKAIEENVVAGTFAKFIKHVGVKKVKSLGLQCRNVPLISTDKESLSDIGHKDLGNGLYLVTHSSTLQKKRQIEKIADLLNLDIKVEFV